MTEVILEDAPGTAVYRVKLIDADPKAEGKQPFGDNYQGKSTGNQDGKGDGNYAVFLKGEEVGRFLIKTSSIKDSERLECLDAIYTKTGNRSLNSKVFGHRLDQSIGTAGDDNLHGDSNQDDTLSGRAGRDLLNGVGDRLTGATLIRNDFATDQVDILIGGKGADTFQLADMAGSFYNALGTTDRALIRDFSAGDRLLLYGQASDYAISRSAADKLN